VCECTDAPSGNEASVMLSLRESYKSFSIFSSNFVYNLCKSKFLLYLFLYKCYKRVGDVDIGYLNK